MKVHVESPCGKHYSPCLGVDFCEREKRLYIVPCLLYGVSRDEDIHVPDSRIGAMVLRLFAKIFPWLRVDSVAIVRGDSALASKIKQATEGA